MRERREMTVCSRSVQVATVVGGPAGLALVEPLGLVDELQPLPGQIAELQLGVTVSRDGGQGCTLAGLHAAPLGSA